MLLMRAVFDRHDRSTFHVVCFSTRALPGFDTAQREKRETLRDDEAGAHLPQGCAEVVEIGEGASDAQARVINRKQAHVLVDLNGWTAGHAMGALAFRPAPVIINYMGFAGSTGAEFVDFSAFDAVAAPPDHHSHFSERLLLLPHSYFVTDFLRVDFSAAVAARNGGVGGGGQGQGSTGGGESAFQGDGDGLGEVCACTCVCARACTCVCVFVYVCARVAEVRSMVVRHQRQVR